MRLGPFGPKATTSPTADTPPDERIAFRARAAQARESAIGRRSAKSSGDAARDALNRKFDEEESRLETALRAVSRFPTSTQILLADELDAASPITQRSTLGRAMAPDAGLPGWLRERALRADAERVVLDWLTFRTVFAAHREYSARPADDPLPQLYEALSLQPSESIAVEGVETAGLVACTRILHVAFSLRSVQRAHAARAMGTATGYAAADAWRAFDRSHRFITAEIAEWIVDREPGDAEIAAAIASGRFSTTESTPEGRSTGISPHAIDEKAFVTELRRTQPRV